MKHKILFFSLLTCILTAFNLPAQTSQSIAMNDDLIEFKITSLSEGKSGFLKKHFKKNKDYVLVLEAADTAAEKLMMTIGKQEAAELAIAIEALKTPRPLPSEVLKTVITELGFKLDKVVIDDLVGGIFYAKMILTKESEIKTIDCRPADAITQSVRSGCKLFVARKALEKYKHA